MDTEFRPYFLALIFALPSLSLACPTGMVQIGEDFCIDQYEASLDGNNAATSVPGVFPQVNISQIEASAVCSAAGKRLCTDQEWLRACRGPNDFTYPYGNVLQPGQCNDTGSLSETGMFPGCATAEGALDMVGNVGEWTADPSGTFRGGFFADIAVNGPGCLYRTTAHNVFHSDAQTGFRCCSDDLSGPSEITVEIDIKPGSDPNCFNLNGHGVIPVAVLGSAFVNATQIDAMSLSFGGLEVRVRGNKGPSCSIENSNGDSYLDMVCRFEDDSANWSAGEDTAALTGMLFDGTAIAGSDSICIVP